MLYSVKMRVSSVLLPLLYGWIPLCCAQTTYVATLQIPDNLFNSEPTSTDFTGLATTATNGITQFVLNCGGVAPSFCPTDANGLNPRLYFNVSSSSTFYNLTTSGYENCGPTASSGGYAACTLTPANLVDGNRWFSRYTTNGAVSTALVSYLTNSYSSVYPVTFTYLEDGLASAIGATKLNTISFSSTRPSNSAPTTSPQAKGSLSSPTSSATSSPTGSNGFGDDDTSGLTSREKIGIGLGVAFGVLAIASVGLIVYRRRKAKTRSNTPGAHLYYSSVDKGETADTTPGQGGKNGRTSSVMVFGENR